MGRARVIIVLVHQRICNLHLRGIPGGDEPVSVHKAVGEAAAEGEGGVGPFGGGGVVGHLLLQGHAAFHGALYS
jgi:hypothetical protein